MRRDAKKIKRALISVSDKTGLAEFANALHKLGIEIISTGGSAKFIKELSVPVRNVSDYTGFPEMLDGRVKTLHPKIHGALLAKRDNPEHMRQVKEHGIELIDMVVVNLYPFEKTVAREGVMLEEAVENIDIGGPSMLRSAAKNFKDVAVVCNPARYPAIIAELEKNAGALGDETRKELAVEVFERTSAYDGAINSYLAGKLLGGEGGFLPIVRVTAKKLQALRYGENPHQQAAFYKTADIDEPSVAAARQLHGKELSFNNILDLSAALEIVEDFSEPCCAIIKHNNPCGVALADTLKRAYRDAFASDPISAFGGIIGFNRDVEEATADAILKGEFVECIIAPAYSKGALDILKQKKNLRLLAVGPMKMVRTSSEHDIKKVVGGLLVQTRDFKNASEADLKVVTKKKPTKPQTASLLFADRIAKHVKSNAIVFAKGTRTIGIGAGQTSRVDSVYIAAKKAGKNAKGACLASDAFFPKEDGIKAAAKAGIVAIIQPGGSVRDEEVIKTADKLGIAMVFTCIRHFKH